MVFFNDHLACGQYIHLGNLGPHLDRIRHQAHIVEHVPHNSVITVHAGFGQEPHALSLIDLALDQQLLDLHLVEGGPGADLRLGIKSVYGSHYGQGCAIGQSKIFGFQVLGFLVGKQSVAQIGGSGNGQILGKVQSVSVGNKGQNIRHLSNLL